MPVSIKQFIGSLESSVTDVDRRIQLNANYGDDRIDYAGAGISGGFMDRREIDACSTIQDMQVLAVSRAKTVAILMDHA